MTSEELDLYLAEDNSGSSYYRTSFFEIYTAERYASKLEDLNARELGFFVHEYIHYLQNISTPWGLYSSIVKYEGLIELIRQLQTAGSIEIPFNATYSPEHISKSNLVSFGEGTADFKQLDLYSKQIDANKGFSIQCVDAEIESMYMKKYCISFTLTNGRNVCLDLGAKIIRESMAFMYQNLIDGNYVTKHDVPYNIIAKLCECKFKNIASDKKKLIALCYLSLFTLTPGNTLIDLLYYANNNPELTIDNHINLFLADHKAVPKKGKTLDMVQFCDYLTDKLEDVLEKLIPTGLDFLSISLEAARLSNGFVPVLNVLYSHDEEMGVQHIKALTEYLGVPYLTDGNHVLFLNNLANGQTPKDVFFMRMLAIMHEAIVCKSEMPYCPSINHECDSNAKSEKYFCSYEPWNDNPCAYTEILKLFGLKDKPIKTRY